MNEDFANPYKPLIDEDRSEEISHLWIVSYSDFMTILMIFFLMCFAHRVWEKKVFFEDQKIRRERAIREVQDGMVRRLDRLSTIDVQAERIDIHLPDSLLFSGGQSDMRGAAKLLLADIVPDLKKFKGDIIVEGHTDDLPLGRHSHFGSNWELSTARAFSVIKFLEQEGVDPGKMSARGYGEYRPRVPNISPENRAENRRIELILLNPRKDG